MEFISMVEEQAIDPELKEYLDNSNNNNPF